MCRLPSAFFNWKHEYQKLILEEIKDRNEIMIDENLYFRPIFIQHNRLMQEEWKKFVQKMGIHCL